jgi:hypothetical protein
MNWIKDHSTRLRQAFGWLLLVVGAIAAYWWFYRLAPVRHLADADWIAAHSARAHWQEEQNKYRRLNASPDLCFDGDRIGYFGDKQWCWWLIERIRGSGRFRVCGCTETALMLMTNQETESWQDWAHAHRNQTQEEWLLDGFARRGVRVHLPPQPEDTVPLLEVLGHKTWNTLWAGPQKDQAPEAFPDYFQYNAFRWLRDSGFDPTGFAVENAPAFTVDTIRIGLIQYGQWYADFPGRGGIGRLAFAQKPNDDSRATSPLLRSWHLAKGWLLVIIPIMSGTALLRWRKTWRLERLKRAWNTVKRHGNRARQWSRIHRRLLLAAGLAAGCLAAMIVYHMLPVWRPDYVISHSTSPERILRASHFAFNGHFQASPALEKILGDAFGDFLVQKLSSSDDATIDAAAWILAYSCHPSAEKALIETFLRGHSEDLQVRLLRYLSWTCTDSSREFLTGILEHRIKGVRSAALRALAASSITGRYEIISPYRQDPDEKVRKEAKEALEDRATTPVLTPE